MVWRVAVLALATHVFAAPVPTSPSPSENLDFELGATGGVPEGWSARNAMRAGFRVAIDAEGPHGGHQCVEIGRDGAAALAWALGGISHRADATPYRGHRVVLSGWLRYSAGREVPQPGSAQLWLRVYFPGSKDSRYYSTSAHPVRSATWTEARLLAEVPEDADSVRFGVALETGGTMWADDLALGRGGAIGEGDEPPRPLDDRSLENLIAFARLLGYVRYFHPSDQAAIADWDGLSIAGVDGVERARTPAELVARLREVFRPLAPTLRLATSPLSPPAPAALAPSGTHSLRITGWWHLGWTDGAEPSPYEARRVSIPVGASSDSILPIGTTLESELGGGVWCSMPMTLYADERGTLPHGVATTVPSRRPEDWLPSGNDRATRLADVVLFWTTAEHFYPYFDVTGTDWAAELPNALRRAATDRDGSAFEITLRRLVSSLHDGHGTVNSPYGDPRPMPLFWSLVDGQLVVERVDASIADRVRVGDVVTTIAGRPVTEWASEAESIRSGATPQWLRVRVAEALQVMPGGDSVLVGVRSPGGRTASAWLPRRDGPLLKPPRPDSVTEIRPGVIYLDLDRIDDADFEKALPRIVAAKGVIFDLRGYPARLSSVVLAHLTDTTLASARWCVPIVRHPDHTDTTYVVSRSMVTPATPRIRARAAFLIDGRAISYAETLLGIVEYYRLAELVGEPTAGTNGNVASERLPGGYDVTFTGMRVLKHDGSRHHGVGILPTVPVSPTLAGIAAGRDEQLEKAIEVVTR